MIWLVLLALATLLFWYTCIRPMNYFTRIGVKQTTICPIFGDQWKMIFKRSSISEFIRDLYKRFPNTRYSGSYQFTRPALIIRDPELIKQIAVKDFDHFTDHMAFFEADMEPLWSKNLFSLKGQKWREMRVTLSGSFTSSKMKHMFHLMNEAAVNFVNYFKEKDQDVIEIEMKDTYTRYTTDVIATTAFGIKVDSLNDPNNIFYAMGKKVTQPTGVLTTLKFLVVILLPKLSKLLKINLFDKEVSKYFRNIIHETIETREKQHIVRQDMINLLLETRKGIKDEENDARDTGFATVEETDLGKIKQMRSFTNDDITSQALIFFFAGFETVSTAMCFGTYEIATNKHVQDKLRQEIIETNKANNGKLTYDTLLKMKYMDMVVSEILRKWPPALATDRVCTKPYIIEPKSPDEKPVHIKVGDFLSLPTQGIQWDPDYYPEPETFNPERFSDENKSSIKPYTYFPFGVGPRNCIGSRFALLEIKALLYNLLLNFEIIPTKKTCIPLKLSRKSFNHTIEGGFWLGLKAVEMT